MNWDDLRVFLAVVETGSIRSAAKNIGVTHATVSRHLRNLQTVLGNPLLERRQNGQCLTELGSRILPIAKQVEMNVADIDRAAFSAETGLAGALKVSLSDSLYISLLYNSLDNFMRQYPMIELNVDATNDLLKLSLREADVIIRITSLPPDTAYGKKIANSPVAIYASPQYVQTRPSLDRWIGWDYERAKTPTIPANIIAQISTPAIAERMIELSRGVGILPCYMGDNNPKLIRLDDNKPQADMEIWVLTHKDLRVNPRVRALMDHLYNAFAQLRPAIDGSLTQSKN
ncbi:MAG: LysR family transcriptional regulator [Hyphomicrobiales bacterium]